MNSPRIFQTLLDNALGLSILLAFVAAILAAIIQARRRDRALLVFNTFPITVLLHTGKRIWGTARVFPNGIVLYFRAPRVSPRGIEESSFILHEKEYDAVRAILRRDVALSPRSRARRDRELHRFRHPTLARRASRWARNQISVLRDAFLRTLNMILGQARRIAAPTSRMGGLMSAGGDQEITRLGTTVVGSVELATDPILENLFARPCVAEMLVGEKWLDVPGILGEYSTRWITMLDTVWPRDTLVTLENPDQGVMSCSDPRCEIHRTGDALVIVNHEPFDMEFAGVTANDKALPMRRMRIAGGATETIPIPSDAAFPMTVRLVAYEPADVLLPRSAALVRHHGAARRHSGSETEGE